MKLGLDSLRDPTKVLDTWKSLADKPFGKQLFSRMVGLMAPYTGTISPLVLELAAGHARVQIRDRWGLRNHLRSVHAIALMNLGEATTGLAVMSQVPAGGRGIPRELSMEYIKKARGTITCESRVELPTAPGTHDVDVFGELRNSIGEVVAKIRARWRIDLPARAGATASFEVEETTAAVAAGGADASSTGAGEPVTEGTPPGGDLPDEVAGEPVTEGTPPAGDVPDEGTDGPQRAAQ